MAKVKRNLIVERVEYTASTMKTRQLPLSVMRGLMLELKIVHTNGGGAAFTIKNLLDCITKIEVVLNGQDTRVSIPFYFLYYMNMLEFSMTPHQALTTAVGAQTSFVHVYLPFALLRAAVPQDTLLDARKLSTCILHVHWAAGLAGTDITSTDSGYLDIQSVEYANVPIEAKFSNHEYGWDIVNIDKVGTNTIHLETLGTNQYRRLWLFAFAAAGTASDAELDNIILKARSFTFIDSPSVDIQSANMMHFAQTLQTGIFVLDLPSDGMMSGRLDARALPELTLEINGLLDTGALHIIKEKAIYA